MTYIVMDPCVKCKFMDCVEVCPVDAIKPDTEDEGTKWLEINTKYAAIWPNISEKGTPPADREDYERETGKFEKYFSEKPGDGK
ncbi:ferredoxin family protein [Asticcacaulis sp.]|uniref:ferredoxin family protein n=1 Tax=Asticcacaulis sp. TaxID=1872648 RepID=UPI003F7BE029